MVGTMIPMAVIIGIFYVLVIAPANKQRKKTEAMLGALKKGDKVVSAGGIHGTIHSVDTETVILKISDNVKIKISRSSIAGLAGETEGKQPELRS